MSEWWPRTTRRAGGDRPAWLDPGGNLTFVLAVTVVTLAVPAVCGLSVWYSRDGTRTTGHLTAVERP